MTRLALTIMIVLTTTRSHASPEPAPDPTVARALTIVLGGDVALPTGPNDAAIDALGARVFEHLRPWLDTADLAFANLETPFTTRPATVRKSFPMTSPPARLDWILDAGFDLLSLANNHMGDAGPGGVVDTIAHLVAARAARGGALWWDGAGDDHKDGVVFTPPGKSLRVALLALGNGPSPTIAHLPGDAAARRKVLARVRALAAASDLMIVSLHGGTEYQHTLDPALADLSRAVVDAGADVVVAHHPHVVRGIERHGAGVILHGVGNLAFATMTERHRARDATLWGVLPILHVVDGRLDHLRVVPLWVDNVFPLELPGHPPAPAAALQPRPLTGVHAGAALDALTAWSAALPHGARIERVGDEGIVALR